MARQSSSVRGQPQPLSATRHRRIPTRTEGAYHVRGLSLTIKPANMSLATSCPSCQYRPDGATTSAAPILGRCRWLSMQLFAVRSGRSELSRQLRADLYLFSHTTGLRPHVRSSSLVVCERTALRFPVDVRLLQLVTIFWVKLLRACSVGQVGRSFQGGFVSGWQV